MIQEQTVFYSIAEITNLSTHQHSKFLRRLMNERRILKKNLRDYPTRVRIIKNLTALSRLHRARNALKDIENQNASILTAMSLELHHKLNIIQTIVLRLKKSQSR
jgi:hypothetical protein